MNKNSELIKNTIIIFVGKFCTQFISFLLVPIYTHYISTGDYGYLDLIQSYMSLLVPILILRFDSGVFRFLIDERNNEDGKQSIISNTIIFLIIQIIIFSLLFIIVNYFLGIKFGLAILLATISMAISSILLQISRGIGDNVGYSISSIVAGIITIILNILFVVIFKKDISYVLLTTAIANFGCAILLVIRNHIYNKVSKNKLNKTKFKNMLKYSLPMIPDGLSWWVINVSDRSIISFVIDSAANGIYAVSSKFSNILSSIFQIFNMSWQESASLHINSEDRDEFFSNVLNESYKIFYSLCLIIMVFMPIIFKIFIGNNYQSAVLYVPFLLYGNLFNAIANVIGGVYIAKKETKSVARTTVMAAIINIIINIIFIKKIGLFAATISTLISYIILTFYRYLDVKKYIKMRLDKRLFLLTTLFFIFSTILYYFDNIIINIINILISLILCYIISRKEIKGMLNKVILKLKRLRRKK